MSTGRQSHNLHFVSGFNEPFQCSKSHAHMHTQVGNTNLLSDQHSCLSSQKKKKSMLRNFPISFSVFTSRYLKFFLPVPLLSDPFYLAVATLFRERLEARELLDYHWATRDPWPWPRPDPGRKAAGTGRREWTHHRHHPSISQFILHSPTKLISLKHLYYQKSLLLAK